MADENNLLIGPGTIFELNQILEKENLAKPTASDNIDDLLRIWENPELDENKKIIQLLKGGKPGFLYSFTFVFPTKEGIYVKESPIIKDEMIIINEADLKAESTKVDGSIKYSPDERTRFTLYNFKIGKHVIDLSEILSDGYTKIYPKLQENNLVKIIYWKKMDKLVKLVEKYENIDESVKIDRPVTKKPVTKKGDFAQVWGIDKESFDRTDAFYEEYIEKARQNEKTGVIDEKMKKEIIFSAALNSSLGSSTGTTDINWLNINCHMPLDNQYGYIFRKAK
jgi:hypothetical protein